MLNMPPEFNEALVVDRVLLDGTVELFGGESRRELISNMLRRAWLMGWLARLEVEQRRSDALFDAMKVPSV